MIGTPNTKKDNQNKMKTCIECNNSFPEEDFIPKRILKSGKI